MRKRIGLILAVCLALSLLAGAKHKVAGAAAKNRTVTVAGWVSDAYCGALHTKPGGADCVRKCIGGGQDIGHPEWKPQKMVFVRDTDKKIWTVENPDTLKGHEGQHVQVTGRVNAQKKSVHVLAVTLVGEEEEKK